MCSEIDSLVDEFRWTLACEPSVYSYFGHRRVLVVAVVVGLVVVVAAAAATDQTAQNVARHHRRWNTGWTAVALYKPTGEIFTNR